MTDYYLSCTFRYDGDLHLLRQSIIEWVTQPDFSLDVKFRAFSRVGVPPIEWFKEAAETFVDESLELGFTLRRGAAAGRGKLSLMSPALRGEYSRIELRFSLAETFRGLFSSTAELRTSLLRLMEPLSAEIAQVEADDFDDAESSKKYAIFQRVDPPMPVNFEWITVFRTDVLQRLGWNIEDLPTIEGVVTGQSERFFWITLTDHPFSYSSGVGTEQQRSAEAAFRLAEHQAAYRRAKL